MSSVTSESVRRELADALRIDLVGPNNDHAFARELVPEPPSRWYLTGFLVPSGASLERRSDPTSQEELDLAGELGVSRRMRLRGTISPALTARRDLRRAGTG